MNRFSNPVIRVVRLSERAAKDYLGDMVGREGVSGSRAAGALRGLEEARRLHQDGAAAILRANRTER